MSRADVFGLALNPGGQQKVAPLGPSVFPPVTAESFEPDIATLEHVATIGSRAPERAKRGMRSFGGDVEGGARPLSFGVLLSMAFGSPVSSVQPNAAEAPSVWRHTWNPLAAGKAPLPATAWTVNVDDPAGNIVDQYVGVMMDELAFAVESNDYLLFTATLGALRNVEGGAAPVATRDATELWSFDEVGAEISIPSVAGGAWTPIALYDWNFSYGNSLSGGDQGQLGSKEPVKFRVGNIESTVGFTAAENLESHYRRAIADRPELVRMRLSAKGRELFNGGGTPANALHESLVLEFRAIEYSSGNIPIDASETLESIEVEGNVVMDSGGNLLTVTLTNQHNGTHYSPPVA